MKRVFSLLIISFLLGGCVFSPEIQPTAPQTAPNPVTAPLPTESEPTIPETSVPETAVPTEPPLPDPAYEMQIAYCDTTFLRELPHPESSCLARIPAGETVGFLENAANGYCRVCWKDMVGYLPGSFLAGTEVLSRQTVIRCSESITLRDAPSTSGGEITQIPLGETVELLEYAENGFSRIRCRDQVGYALTSYLSFAPEAVFSPVESQLPDAEEDDYLAFGTEMYTYDDMTRDLSLVMARYPGFLSVRTLCITPDNRQVFEIIAGDPDSENQILVFGGIHAREYITAKLVMRLLLDYAARLEAEPELYGQAAFHLIPMSNPDGTSISQFGMDGIQTEECRAQMAYIAAADGRDLTEESYLRGWKANAQGVDLNRQFDALWETYSGSTHPSAERWKGTLPGCAPESQALIALAEAVDFDVTVSYHTMGEVIYWYFGQDGAFLETCRALGKAVSASTGYPTDANYQSLDPAGYKDYLLYEKGIPSLTIEVGKGTNPVSESQIDRIYQQNKDVLRVLLDFVTE